MFCPRCGKEISAGVLYCPFCGTATDGSGQIANAPSQPSQGGTEYFVQTGAQKSTKTTLFLSLAVGLLLMGCGQIYVGKVLRGVGFMAWGLILDVCFLAFGGIACVCISVCVYIWQAYDAYQLTKQYNDAIVKLHHPPW